jgi:hypothetical protein
MRIDSSMRQAVNNMLSTMEWANLQSDTRISSDVYRTTQQSLYTLLATQTGQKAMDWMLSNTANPNWGGNASWMEDLQVWLTDGLNAYWAEMSEQSGDANRLIGDSRIASLHAVIAGQDLLATIDGGKLIVAFNDSHDPDAIRFVMDEGIVININDKQSVEHGIDAIAEGVIVGLSQNYFTRPGQMKSVRHKVQNLIDKMTERMRTMDPIR